MSDVVVVSDETPTETPPAAPPVVVVSEPDSGPDLLALAATVGQLVGRMDAVESRVFDAEMQAGSAQSTADVALDVAIDAESAAVDASLDALDAGDAAEADVADALDSAADALEDGATPEQALEAAAEEVRDEGPVSKPWTHKSFRDWFGGDK